MLTLQIHDGTETFLLQLDERSVDLGAGDVDVRLRSDGVSPRHARLEIVDGSHWIRAIDGAVRLNGRAVEHAELALGDRIEVGAAVAIVGQSVARKAAPDDVLAPARRESKRRPAHRRGWLVPVLAAAGAALGIVLYALLGTSDPGLPTGFAELDRLRRAGSFELAQRQIDRLRADWAIDAERGRRLDGEQARLDRTQQLVADRRQQILGVAATRTYAEFSDELQRDERAAGDEEVRIAARIVRASLFDLLRHAASALPAASPVAATTPPASAPNAPARPTERQPEPATRQQEQPAPSPVAVTAPARGQDPAPDAPERPAAGSDAAATVTTADVTAVMRATTALVASGRFRQAENQLRLAIAGASAADQPQLQQRVVDLRGAAKRLADQLVERARNEMAAGRFDGVIAELADAIDRFPAGLEFAGLPVMLDLVQREQRASGAVATVPLPGDVGVDAATRRATLAAVGPALETARTSEAAGDYAGAATALQPALDAIRERDPDYAQQLDARVAELRSIVALHEAVGAFAASGTRIDLALRSGRTAQLRSALGCHLVVGDKDGEVEIAWSEILPASLARLATEPRLSAEAHLGAAALLYRSGDAKAAETALSQALKAEPALKERIDRAIARGRGEPLDPRGYRLGKDGFVAVAVLDAEKSAQKVLTRLDNVVRSGDAAARDAFLTDALSLGPSALRPVVAALQKAMQQQVETLERSPLQKQTERLAAQRAELDAARTFAKELIFDEVKYFYPYRPPQVSTDRYTEYMKVQTEVDRRVAAVQAIWTDERQKIRVPSTLADALVRVDWLTSALRDLGELDPLAVGVADWARALPATGAVTVQDFALSPQERAQFDEWDRIDAYNASLADKLDSGEREQVAVTNAYRRMFGHRPLAVDLKLRDSARGHADEMNKLGYFSHFSPTEGLRTPSDRMQLAGYKNGVSENIALNDSATGAHVAWCHSSGHHRNLLMPTHTEFGTSGVGRNWVQNFGTGTGYVEAMAAMKKPKSGR